MADEPKPVDDLNDVPAGAGKVPLPTGQASPSVGGGIGGDFPGGVMADDPVGHRDEPKIDLTDLEEKPRGGVPMESP